MTNAVFQPEGLTDDDEEEDQNSEYSTTEGSMGDESEVKRLHRLERLWHDMNSDSDGEIKSNFIL